MKNLDGPEEKSWYPFLLQSCEISRFFQLQDSENRKRLLSIHEVNSSSRVQNR
jgi:hypothetical protein